MASALSTSSLRAVLIACVLLLPALAGEESRARPDDRALAVLSAQKARWDAYLARDFAALEPLLSPELVYVHSGLGGVIDMSRDAYLTRTREDTLADWVGVSDPDPQVRFCGDVAIVTGRVKLHARKPHSSSLGTPYTAIYRQRAGRWELAFFARAPGPEILPK